jgi:hypothetical protein
MRKFDPKILTVLLFTILLNFSYERNDSLIDNNSPIIIEQRKDNCYEVTPDEAST